VFAVDHDPVVHVARAVAEANGLSDRVTCVRGSIPHVAPPAPVDVLVFEDFPTRLLDARVFLLYGDLQAGLLAPGARTIPRRARLFVAPVSSERLRALVQPFGESDRAFGLDWRPSAAYVANQPLHVPVEPRDVPLPARAVREIDFGAPLAADALQGTAAWTVERDVVLDGLVLWFDLELTPDEWLSNAPGAHPCSWGHLFLPIASRLQAPAGAVVEAAVEAPADSTGTPGWLGWSLSSGGVTARGNEFASVPASLTDMLAASPDGVPRLSRRGAIAVTVLTLADGRRSLREIAQALRTAYPELTGPEAVHVACSTLEGRAAGSGPNGKKDL
jgi:hypothetical protein